MLVRDAAVTTHRVGHLTRRDRARRVRRAAVELGEAERDQRLDHVVDVAPAQHAEHAAPLARDVERAVERGDERLDAGRVVRAVDDDHRACAR